MGKQSKFTWRKSQERKLAQEIKDKRSLENITATIMAKTREEWLMDAKELFPPLHGEILDDMTKEEIIEYIRLYDIDYRSGKPVRIR